MYWQSVKKNTRRKTCLVSEKRTNDDRKKTEAHTWELSPQTDGMPVIPKKRLFSKTENRRMVIL